MNKQDIFSPIDLPAPQELDALLNNARYKTHKSNTPLFKLKRNTLTGLYFAAAITIGYFLIILRFHIWQVQLSMLVLIVFNTWIMSTGYQLYRDIQLNQPENSLLQNLKHTHDLFIRWMKEQEKAAIFVYPIAATGGFILGGVVGSGKSADLFLSKWFVWVALLVTIIILIPIAIWVAKKLNRMAYGKYLDQIKLQIGELEQE